MGNIAGRFAREITEHQMTVLHDEGLYRHLQFRRPRNGLYWFDLITVPGTLIFQGDGESYVFRRTTDMFEFFRGSTWKGWPNPQYWAEKLTDDRNAVLRYDQDLLVQHVKDALADHYGKEPVPVGLEDAVRTELFEEFLDDETYDRKLVDEFRWYADDEARYAFPAKAPDFEFGETCEWNCRDYHWWFLWACHAIVWGIAKYDAKEAS